MYLFYFIKNNVKYGLLIIIPINLNNKIKKYVKFNRLFVLNIRE